MTADLPGRTPGRSRRGSSGTSGPTCPTPPTCTSTSCSPPSSRAAPPSTTTSCCSSSSTRPPSCGSSSSCTSCAPRCDDLAADELAPGAEEARPRQAHPAHAHRAVVGAGHADPGRVRRVPRRPGHVVGFQSTQYRAVEFLLGNKNAAMLRLFEHDERALARARRSCSSAPSRLRRVPAPARPARAPGAARAARPRRPPRPRRSAPSWWTSSPRIYDDTEHYWDVYETCEELVDIEENFQLWRFRHLKTVRAHDRRQARHRRLQRGAVPARGRWSSRSSPSCTRSAPRSGRNYHPHTIGHSA